MKRRENWKLAVLILALIVLPSTTQAASGLEDSIHELAIHLAETMVSSSVRKVAVIEFSDLNGYRSALGPFIAEELTTQLFIVKPGAFDVVERQQLAKVLQEQKLSTTSLFDAETIANIGKILGIQAIVTGSIADLGNEIKINARSISVETARVFAAGSTKCPKQGMVENLMRQGAVPGPLGVAATEGRPSGRQIQQSDVFFQNSFLRLTVDSLALSKDKKEATLALRVENLTTTDLLLGVFHRTQRCRTGLIDNQGNKLDPAGAYQDGAIGIACIEPEYAKAEYFTKFSPKGRSTIIFPFRLMDGEITGDVFSFSAELLMFEAGKVVRFSAGISNIELRR
jgi:TolB-like protein